MTLNPVCENVETAQGVPLTETGVAQVNSYNESIARVGRVAEVAPTHEWRSPKSLDSDEN